MNLAAVLSTARTVKKATDKVMGYIEKDQKAKYSLNKEVTVILMGDGVLGAPSSTYTTDDESLTIELLDRSENGGTDAIKVTAHPFEADSNLWNGPDVIPNNKYRSMLASLFHDLIWEHCDELAKAWDCTSQDVLEWGNGVLYSVWKHASGSSKWGKFEARIAWRVCQLSKLWYHKVRRLLNLAPIFVLLFMVACFGPPQWTVVELENADEVKRVMAEQGDGLSVSAASSSKAKSGCSNDSTCHAERVAPTEAPASGGE